MSLFESIAQTANPDNHPQLGAKFEVTWLGRTSDFTTQSEAKDFARDWRGLYQVVIYIAGTRQVIYSKQY